MDNVTRRGAIQLVAAAGVVATLGSAAGAEDAAKPEMYGITITTEDKPKSSDLVKPKGLKKTNDIEVLDYDLIGGPTVFHGQAWVFKKDNHKTFTFGEVSKGPMGGMFEGSYYLTTDQPNWFAYSPKANPRHGLWVQLFLGKDHGWVWYRYGRKRLIGGGWIWYAWERPLVSW